MTVASKRHPVQRSLFATTPQIVARPNAVVQPEYWRKRIDALAKSSAATTDTTRYAAGLLQRLLHLSEVLDRDGWTAEMK
jgi:hypothetical protein